METIRIIDFSPELRHHFKEINEEWLKKDFCIEPIDEKVLNHPEDYILKNDGQIIYVEVDGQIAGTVALKRMDTKSFELTKMGVRPVFQGKKLGELLARTAIERAWILGADKVILYSSTNLGAALNLYRKLGFTEVELESGGYARCNIKMELIKDRNLTSEQRKQLIESYGKAYEKILTCLNSIPKEMWDWKPAPHRWSIRENIIHLADSEANSYIRCRRFIAEPGTTVMAYNQDKWASDLNYRQQSTEDALELFRLLRKMSYDLIKSLPESTWNNTINHPENGTMSFNDWLRIYENHTHIGQMQRTYQEWKKNTTNETKC